MEDPAEESAMLERIFLRVGLANSDAQLESILAKFLPLVISKVSSPHESVRNKVIELLSHVSKRVKTSKELQLPVVPLLELYQNPSTSPFVTNFTIIYIKQGFPRLPLTKQVELIPVLVSAGNDKPVPHQESLIVLILNTISKMKLSDDDVKKKLAALEMKPPFKKLCLEIMMDVLLFPYSGTDQNLGELSPHGYKRLVGDFVLMPTPNDVESVKKSMIEFLTGGLFDDNDMYPLLIVASSDPRFSVADLGDFQLKKIQKVIDYDSVPVVTHLYSLYLGGGEGVKLRAPATIRLKLKLLPQLSKFHVVLWPIGMKILFESLYGESSNPRLKTGALNYCSTIIEYVPEGQLSKVGTILLDSALLKLIKAEETEPPLRRLAYSLISKLVRKLPNLVKNNLSVLHFMFGALREEFQNDVISSIRDSLVGMAPAFKDSSQEELMSLLVEQLNSPVPKSRSVAVHYISCALNPSPQQVYLLIRAASSLDDEVSSQGKKALYGQFSENKINLPSFIQLLTHMYEEQSKSKLEIPLLLEGIKYLRLCLWHGAGITVTLERVNLPFDDSPKVADYLKSLMSSQPLLIKMYLTLIFKLLDAHVDHVPLSSLLEVVGSLPELCTDEELVKRHSQIKGLLAFTKEDVRELSAMIFAMLVCKEPSSTLKVIEDCLKAGGKDLEKLHGHIACLGFIIERGKRCGSNIDPNSLLLLDGYLESQHQMLVGVACTAVGLAAQGGSLGLPSETSKPLIGKIRSVAFNNKVSSKTREYAVTALGQIAIGEGFEVSETIIEAFLEKANEVSDIELVLSMGESLSDAILGVNSVNARDKWVTQKDESHLHDNPSATAKSNEVLNTYLNRFFSLSREVKNNQRQSICFWLLSIIKTCSHLEAVKTRLPEIQSTFMSLLSDKSTLVQEAAGKGLALVYQATTDPTAKQDLLKSVINQLTSGKRSVEKVADNTQLFEESELGSSPTGGKLSTYKEICALASDMNQPDLIYKFMHLVNHNAVWNSKKGAAFGVSSIADIAGEDMECHLPNIIARLYRYQYDPTPSIQQSMSSIWHSVTKPDSVEKYHKEIFEDLLTNLTCPQWRVRISCCNGFKDFLRKNGHGIFDDSPDRIPELWKSLFRVMDDIHEGTRVAAQSTASVLSKICVKLCAKEQGKSGELLASYILPVILDEGIKHNVSEVRSVSIMTVSEMVKSGVIESQVVVLIPALIIAAAELESSSLNALSVMYSGNKDTQDAIEVARASALKSHFTIQTLARCIPFVKPEMLPELMPQITELLRTSVGLGSRIASAHVLIHFCHHLKTEDLQPYCGKLLKVLTHGLSDRNVAIRKQFATVIGHILKFTKDSYVEKTLIKFRELYFEKQDEQTQLAIGYTLQAISSYSHEQIVDRRNLIMPLVFFARHELEMKDGTTNAKIQLWNNVWDELFGSNSAIISNEVAVFDLLKSSLDSPNWSTKAQAARAIETLGSKLGDSLSVNPRLEITRTLEQSLAGRIWEGKEFLFDALAAMLRSLKDQINVERQNEIARAVLKECSRGKAVFKCHAIRSMASIIKSLELNLFSEVYPIMRETIEKTKKNDEGDEDKEESYSRSEEKAQLVMASYEALGDVWPSHHATQDEYVFPLLEYCSQNVHSTMRKVQPSLLICMEKVIQKLYFLEGANNAKRADCTRAVGICISTLNDTLGVSKHVKLRKESLNLVYTLEKRLRDVPEEYAKVKEVFDKFFEDLSKDAAPEIKSRYMDLKEFFQPKGDYQR